MSGPVFGDRLTKLIPCIVIIGVLAGCSFVKPRPAPDDALAVKPAPDRTGIDPGQPSLLLKEHLAVDLNQLAAFGPMDDSAMAGTDDDALDGGAPEDLWARVRGGFALHLEDRPRVQRELAWFIRNPDYFQRVAERARPYLYYVVEEAERRHLPLELTLMPIIESAFQPFAYSPSHAAGIWQFVPATARKYGLKRNWWYDGRRDIVASTHAALDYLERLYTELDGDWLLAIAAYNCGEGTVQKAMRRNHRTGKPTDFWSLRLPRETRTYVPRLLAVAAIVAHPERYPISLDPIPNEPYFERVKIDGQIELALAADMADMSLEGFYMLNPGFNRWATAPEGPHRLLVPVDRAQAFRERLAELSPQEQIKWQRHRVRAGETLGGIARHYRTRVSVLQQLNGLRGTLIRAGTALVVPVPAGSYQRYVREDHDDGVADATVHTYRVRRGDTLWDIAQRYRVPVRSLAAWNRIPRGSVLQVGQELTLHTDGVAGGASGGMVVPAVVKKLATQRVVYRVRPGDSLWRIAHRFNVTIGSLQKWNGISRHEYLRPGQRLNLYVDPRRYAGPS
jgi:membrane-bound lytic murein transglycosylase D